MLGRSHNGKDLFAIYFGAIDGMLTGSGITAACVGMRFFQYVCGLMYLTQLYTNISSGFY